MALGVASIDRQILKNNVVALAKAAKVFDVPTILTTVETESFSGYMWPELVDVFPDHDLLACTSMNSWDDKKVRDAVAATGRRKLLLSGLWTEVCINLAAFAAMQDGYELYVVEDACGGDGRGRAPPLDGAHDAGGLRPDDPAAGLTGMAAGLGTQRDL